MSKDKTYTVTGLSREFIKEVHSLALSKDRPSDALIVARIVAPIYIEDANAHKAFIDSFDIGDTVEIHVKGDPRESISKLQIMRISEETYSINRNRTRIYFDDSSWCWLDKFSPDWIRNLCG